MFEAFLNSKTDIDISEDTLTSSVFGVLQYNKEDFSTLLYKCNKKSEDKNSFEIKSIEFWPSFSSVGTTNKKYVEPDLYIETQKYNIIIEAKMDDYLTPMEERNNSSF